MIASFEERAMMENIRLVISDLHERFWKSSLTEGCI